ncbi:hypothetical protein SO802_015707 [Lithocarpus litseifolius]|uniref:Aminotransferase-like plant mobile domain-containing protein n=1 Tax=Lithocarpus litseifolius TaxID=425828 RepID=A0AAW2CZR9_9ROSI
MSITLEDVEVILGLPINGEVFVGPTSVGDWSRLCEELLGFGVLANDKKTLVGKKILISRLVERIAEPLPHDATEIRKHQYAQCYILALLENKIFMDKSGDRAHLMFLEFLRNLCDPPRWVRVPSPKSRPSGMALVHYREQLVRMQSGQIESHLALLTMLPIGSQGHDHVEHVLKVVARLGSGPAANEQANNGHEIESAVIATPSTSAAPLSRPSRGQLAIASPSTSAARGRGRRATASLSTSVVRGHGRRAITLRVVTSPEIPTPIPLASPQPEATPSIPDASP